jgi:hypothetical protein
MKRVFLSCFIVGCAPLPAESATPATPVVPEISASDATFVREQIHASHAVFYDDAHPILGCDVSAAYAHDGTVDRLVALASNELPKNEACSHATQLVTATNGTDGGLTFEPIAAPQISARATRTHLTSTVTGEWVLNGWNDEHALCTLPCDAWLLPGVGRNLRDVSSDRTIAMPPVNASDSRDVVVKMEKEHKEPGIFWAMFGVSVAALPFAVYGTYAMFTSGPVSTTPSSSASSGSASADQWAGVLLMPLLTAGVVAMAGWSFWQLVRKPGWVPVARRELSHTGVRCGLGGCSF